MKTDLTRRGFLGAGAAALGVAVLAPTLLPAAETAGQKRPLKKAIMYDTIGYKGSVLDKFKALKDAGFDGVELSSHMNPREVIKALDETGLRAASVCCSTHWSKPLSDPDPAVREAGVKGIQQALRDALRYDATSVLVVPGVVKDKVSYEDCWQRSIAELRKLLPLAEGLGVKLAIENVWNNFITRVDQAVAYLDEINSPMVGWHFDCGNILRFSPPESWIPALGQRIVKVHLKEYDKTKGKGFNVRFFEGDNDWPAIMKALDAVGYKDWMITEQPGNQTKDAESLKDFVARMDRILAS
jgi:hexulose-6-phosphate isomerase